VYKDVRWLTGFAALALAVFSFPALAAEGIRYTYGELGYQRVDFDNFSENEDAGYLNGSLALDDRLFLVADGSYGTIDTSGPNIDVTTLDAGLGFHTPLNQQVDFVAQVAYVWWKVDAGRFGHDDEDGIGLRGGLRAMVTPKLELNGGVSYVDLSGGDDNTSAYFGAVYNLTEVLSLSGNVDVGDNLTTYGVGLRMYFE
jgi:hypothetical protein